MEIWFENIIIDTFNIGYAQYYDTRHRKFDLSKLILGFLIGFPLYRIRPQMKYYTHFLTPSSPQQGTRSVHIAHPLHRSQPYYIANKQHFDCTTFVWNRSPNFEWQ